MGERSEFSEFSLGKTSAADMEDMNSSQPIPAGWIFKSELQKDGSAYSYYYYPGTQQEFRSYEDLMRYVKYAMAAKLGPYAPVAKSISSKWRKKDAQDTAPTKLSKKSDSLRGGKQLSVPRSMSKPWDDDQSNESDTEDGSERTVSDSSRTETDEEEVEQTTDFKSLGEEETEGELKDAPNPKTHVSKS